MSDVRELVEDSQMSGIVKLLFSVGARRNPQNWLRHVITASAAVLALWIIYVATVAVIDTLTLCSIFLSFMIALLFLTLGARPTSSTDKPPVLDYCFTFVSVACGVYFSLYSDQIVTRISLLDPLGPLDMLFGTVLLCLAVEATRRAVGLGLTVIVVCCLAYNLFGHLLGGVFGHGYISYEHFLDQMVFTTNGIFGAPVRVAATYAFLFVTFGTLLQKAGASEFFFNLAAAISGRSPGGPAKVAVFSSAFFGTISGSPTSDVVTTGSITIPMMRRLGYPKTLSGAVEVAASASGGFLPPVMGSAAFIMVEVTGIGYDKIIYAALIPALLYCVGIYTQVHLASLRHGLVGMDASEIPPIAKVFREGGLFLVPVIAIITALLMGYSVSFVAFFAILSVIAVAALRATTRMGPAKLYHAISTATMRMVPVTAACAAAGLVVGGISMTGLSGKFAHMLYAVSSGQIFIALMASGALAILLGMGMPTPSAYIMSAVLVAPVLIDMGLPTMNVHMFLLFFAVLSAITPPVAVAAYAASSIAEANPLAIAVRAVRLASAAFVIPFAFIFRPELLGQGSALDIALAVLPAALGVVGIAAASEGYLAGLLHAWQRLCLAVGGILLLLPGIATDVAGFAVFILALNQVLIRRFSGSTAL